LVAQIQAAQKSGNAALAEKLMNQLTAATMQPAKAAAAPDASGFMSGVIDRIFGAREQEQKIMTISGPTNVKHLAGCRFNNDSGYQLDNIPESWKEYVVSHFSLPSFPRIS
jgi:hypothetical protein